ncbi:arginyltransferase [Acidithiobacillus marinus]|nr:arginyltransferase [Acidithiobacillus marinus]
MSSLQPCPYLSGQEELLVLSDPHVKLGKRAYDQLLQNGFRRNGPVAYRPMCPQCAACISVRIPVERFQADRGQKRTWARNQDLQLRVARPYRDEQHARLFADYQRQRHPDGGMDLEAERLYAEMMTETGDVETRLLIFEKAGEALAVAVIDQVDNGLSAVYTFFQPDLSRRGLGIFAIMSQIEWARRQGLSYLYLGYWVAGSPKMDYKRRFSPLEGFVAGQWRPLAC